MPSSSSYVSEYFHNPFFCPSPRSAYQGHIMGSKTSWADQWGAGIFGQEEKEYEKPNNSGNKNKKMEQVKVVASTGLDKAKSAASVGAQKVKNGTSTGVKWIKNKCSSSK